MSRRFPFEITKDKNGNPVPKFLDAFELVWLDGAGDPRYYGDMHPDGHFVIRKITTTDGVEHITFYFGDGNETTLEAVWPNRATLEYSEYSEVF